VYQPHGEGSNFPPIEDIDGENKNQGKKRNDVERDYDDGNTFKVFLLDGHSGTFHSYCSIY
jgi:hypothetical protein